jgi:hypothetical protein
MANYCSNSLKVMGEVTELNHFLKRVKDKNEKFTLQRLSPIPKKIKTFDEQDDWENENWGTSYVCDDEFCMIDENKVIIYFLSKWSPPLAWVKYVARFYNGLTFHLKYDEPGIGFKGSLKMKGMSFQESSSVYFKYPKKRYIEKFENY